MPSADRVLLDTHVLLWWKAAAGRLSATAAMLLQDTPEILLSPVSCWEIGMLVTKGRVRLDRPTSMWVTDVLAEDRLGLAGLTPAAAVAAAELTGFRGDPADRLIVATAVQLRVPLVTKDRLIHDYAGGQPELEAVW
ncbi:MAG: type II toxin-antitoxin system VapC family toxin [Pseudonocardia sp.]